MKPLIFLFIFFCLAECCASDNLMKALMLFSAYQQGKVAFGGINREIEIGHQLAALYLREFKLVEDQRKWDWVEGIFKKVAARSGRSEIVYNFFLVESKEVNAFALPGGFVFILSGLLDYVKSDDELACVIAHELIHIEKKHALELMKNNVIFSTLINLGMNGADQSNAGTMLTFSMLQYQRDMELEADWGGAVMAYRAGYNPEGMEEFLRKLSSEGYAQLTDVQKLLLTHPVTSERISEITWRVSEQMADGISRPKILGYIPRYRSMNESFEFWDEKLKQWQVFAASAEFFTSRKTTGLGSLRCSSKNSLIKLVSDVFLLDKKGGSFAIDIWAEKNLNTGGIYFYTKQQKLCAVLRKSYSGEWKNNSWNHIEYRVNDTDIPANAEYARVFFTTLNSEAWFDTLVFDKKDDTEELLINGDFELDTDNNMMPDSFDGENIRLVNECSSGALSCVVGLDSENPAFFITPEFNVLAGKRYLVTFDVKGSGEVELTTAAVFFRNGFQQFIPGSYDNTFLCEGSWVKKGFYLNFMGVASADFSCRLKFKTKSGRIFADNIKIILSEPGYLEKSKVLPLSIWKGNKGVIQHK